MLPKQRPRFLSKLASPQKLPVCGLLLFFLFISLSSIQAQSPIQGVGANFHAGPILRIHPDYPSTNYLPRIYEVEGFLGPRFSESWRRFYPQTRLSLGLIYQELGNNEVIGRSWGVIPRLYFPIKHRSKSKIDFIFGTGLTYFNRRFDVETNPTNNITGSRFNSTSIFQFLYSYTLTQAWTLRTGLSFTHSSNANSRQPNVGTNVAGIFVGMGFRWKNEEIHVNDSSTYSLQERLNEKKRKMGLAVRLATGFSAIGAPGGPAHPIYSGAVYGYRNYKNRVRFVLGSKWFLNTNGIDFVRSRGIDGRNLPLDAMGGVLFAGSEFLFGRLAFIAHAGPYLKQDFLSNHILYTQMGVKYYWKNQHTHPGMEPFVGVYVHAHSGQADFMEIAIGWMF